MPGVFKIKNLEDAEFTLAHPDGAGAVSIASNNIAKIDAVNAALALKANTADLKEIGVGQTWQNVTGSRAYGVTYTNTSGKPIMFSIPTCSNGGIVQLNVNGISVGYSTNASAVLATCVAIVPNGATYSATVINGTPNLEWRELR